MSRRRSVRSIRWYPVVLAFEWLAYLYLLYWVSPYAMTRSLIVVLVVATIITVVSARLFRDGRRGALVAALMIALIGMGSDPRIAVAVCVALVGLIVERIAAKPTPRSDQLWDTIDDAGRAVTFVLGVAIVIAGIQWGTWSRASQDIVAESPFRQSAIRTDASVEGSRPDIYLIMLDGHARADTLREDFGFDESGFLAGLEERGFDVSARSRANYLLTNLTLPSLFNMRLLDDVEAIKEGRLERWPEGATYRQAINTGSAFDVLHDHGYEVVAHSSGYEHVAVRHADRFLDGGGLSDVETVLLGYQTILGPVVDLLAPSFLADQFKGRIDASLASAVDEAARAGNDGPKLVFAHVPGPHPPFVVDAEGRTSQLPITSLLRERVPFQRADQPTARERYVEELRYVDEQALEAVDGILARSPEPPVILVFSDHGTDAGLDWADLDPTTAGERIGNLFAAYTPGHPDLFGEAPTLVNTLPAIFDAYLGTSTPRSPDDTFVWNSKFSSDPIRLPADSFGVPARSDPPSPSGDGSYVVPTGRYTRPA